MGKLMVLRVAGDNRSLPYNPQVEPLLYLNGAPHLDSTHDNELIFFEAKRSNFHSQTEQLIGDR